MATTTQRSTKRISVLMADDHPLVREGLRAALGSHPKIKIAAEAADGEDALRKAKRLKPDVVLLDITMPGLSGLEAARRLRSTLPDTRVVILTMHRDPEFARAASRAGAHGYVLKDASPAKIVEAVERAAQGERTLTERTRPEENGGGEILTRREREVLGLIAQGLTNREVASRLGMGVRTCEKHRENIMRKLGVRGAARLTRYALAHGIQAQS